MGQHIIVVLLSLEYSSDLIEAAKEGSEKFLNKALMFLNKALIFEVYTVLKSLKNL
jgi:hypothetical protein